MFFHPSTNSPPHFCGQNEHIPWISLVAKAIPPEFQPSPTSESKATFPGARTVPPIKKRSFAEREQSGHLFLTGFNWLFLSICDASKSQWKVHNLQLILRTSLWAKLRQTRLQRQRQGNVCQRRKRNQHRLGQAPAWDSDSGHVAMNQFILGFPPFPAHNIFSAGTSCTSMVHSKKSLEKIWKHPLCFDHLEIKTQASTMTSAAWRDRFTWAIGAGRGAPGVSRKAWKLHLKCGASQWRAWKFGTRKLSHGSRLNHIEYDCDSYVDHICYIIKHYISYIYIYNFYIIYDLRLFT